MYTERNREHRWRRNDIIEYTYEQRPIYDLRTLIRDRDLYFNNECNDNQDISLVDANECQFDMRSTRRPWRGRFPSGRADPYQDSLRGPNLCRNNFELEVCNDLRSLLYTDPNSREIYYRNEFPKCGLINGRDENENDYLNIDNVNNFEDLTPSRHLVNISRRHRELRRSPNDFNTVRCEYNKAPTDWCEYQNESFNTTIQQLNQEPQVCLPLPPPSGSIANFVSPPNNMFRGRGNWRQYHQNYFSGEKYDRPCRRRRSHLDDIYLPNYEDVDDLSETEDTSEHHHEKSQNRSRWDIRYTSHKREARKRCLVSTKSHTVVSTSKSGDDDKAKTNDKCKDSEPNKHCFTNTIVRKQSNVSTSDNFKENAHDNSTNNISLNECEKIKDLNKESFELEKDKKSETAVGEENKSVLKQTMKLNDRKNDVNNIDSKNKHSACNDIQPKDKIESATNTLNSNKSNKPEKQCASVDKDSNKAIIQCNDLELNKTDNKISTQSKPKEDAQLHETSLDNAPSNSAESILVAADNDTSIQGVHLDELNLDNVSSNSAESILVTVDNDTPIHGVRLDELSLDNVSSNSAESILTPAEGDNQDLVEGTTLKYMPVSKRTSVPEEQNDSVQDKDKCHPLPAEFPVWRPTPKELKYQNPFMSVREIDSDEETVCFDDFITLDKIDTTKSYLENLSPEFDDYRVIDMILGTPSPPKRKHDEDDVVTKKRKYDHLYAEINSDQLLNEINKVFKEDKQNSESTTTRCIKRNRSKSLCTMPTKNTLPRSRSLQSINKSNCQMTYNFDLKTNLLFLLGGQKLTPMEIDYTDSPSNISNDDVKSDAACTRTSISNQCISEDTNCQRPVVGKNEKLRQIESKSKTFVGCAFKEFQTNEGIKNGKEELLTDEAVPSCSNISKDAQNKKQINNEIKKFEDIQKEHKNDSYSDRVSDENQIKEYAKKAKRDLFKEEVGPTCYSLSAQGISEGKTNDSKTERLDNQKQNKIKTYNNVFDSKVNETETNFANAKNEGKSVKGEATVAPDETSSRNINSQKCEINDKKIDKSHQTEQKSKTCNDQLIHVSKDEAKITERGRDYNSEKQREKKLGASTAESKIVKSSNMNEQRENSDKNKRFSEDSRCFKKERRKLDESKKSVESASLVRYSDYKKSVDLSKKSPPPEMSLCTIMGVRKKITSRRTTFSNENELYLQRMYRLFGSDSDHEQEEKDETKSKKHDDKSAGTKRKVDKDHGSHKREPQQKKSFTESYRKHPSKAKSVDIHRRNSVHGSSAREDDPKKLIIMDKNAYDIPNSNISQKANTSALVNKSSQHKTSHLNNKTLSRSKDISKSKRSSTATTSVESNKTVGSSNKDKYCEKRRVSMSVPSVNEITTSQKSFPEKSDKTERSANKNNLSNNSEDSFASKAINNRIKDKNSKHFKGDSSPKSESRTSSLNNKEKCRLFVDVRKNQLYQVEEYSKKQEKQPKVGKNPTVVENIGRENVKENWHRDKEVNSPIDQNNKGGTRFDEHTVKEQRNVSPIQACDNQNDGISGSMKVQKQIDQSKTTYNKSLLNNVSISSTVLQPKLVLSRIDSQISVNAKMDSNAQKNRKVDVATKEKELPIKKAIETFALELSFMKCSLLAKDQFPMMQKVRRCSVTEDDCCDRAVILESPDVRDKIEIAKQVVIPFPNISNFDQKESSDDVIEIKPDIPIIDLTSEANEMKDEKCLDPPKNNISVKPDEKNDLDLVLEIANNTTGEERITLYRSEETLNNSLDLQAMVASISSSVLSNDDNKTCEDIKIDEDIKTDDKSVGAVSNTVTDKTVPSSQPNTHKKQVPNRGDTIKSAASNIEKSTSVPVPQKSSSHISGLTQLLIEKAINDAFNLREQQSSNLNSTNNNSQANKETSTSGTNKPPTSTSKSIAQKSSTVNIKSVGIPDTSSCQDSTATININVRDPPPYPVQNNTTGTDNITVHNRWNENSGTDPSYAVAQSQRGTESNQITFGFLPQNLRTYANVKKRHAVTQNQSRPDNNSTQMPFETITQSPISEQNSFMAAQTPRQTQNNIAPRTKNSGSEQSLLIASTNQFQNTIQAGPNAISMSPGCTENNTSGQNFFVMSQTPKRMENRVPASLVTQSSRVEQSSNAQNAIGINKTNEQLPLPLTSQSVGQFGAGSPLRNLQLLVANEPEQMQEISYMELNYVGLTLTRYLCYYDGLKKAQLMYSEEIRKLARCLPTIVKQELAQFDNNNYVQFYSLSKEMFKDLKNLNIKASTTNFLKIRTLMKSVYTAMKQIIPNVTISWFYLMLGAMIEPELIQYKSKPFLKDLCNYVTYVSSQIYTRNISVQHQGAAENNVPASDVFTPEQRILLETQLQQYKTICTNQVKLVAMENSLQTNLLKAQQDNISTKVKQNKASSMSARVEGGVMHCRSSGQNTGGTIQAQSLLEYWKNADIENISITPSPVVSVSDAGKGPSVPNVCLSSGGGVPQFKEVRNETLKSYLLSNNSKTSGKRSYPNPAHTNLATQASKQPSTSSSNLTVHSNIVINPTLVNAPTLPKKNISNVANVIRPTATANLSPNLLQMRPSLSKLGTNEIYKIRLPFTKPYDVSCPSPPTTSAPVLKTVVQSSPVQSTIQTGSSMPLLSEDINLPNLSHIQSIGPSPVYAPMAFVHPVVNSLSPPLEISEEPTSSAVENVSHTNDNNSNLPEVKPSTSKESFNTDNSPHVKSETDLQLSDKDIETIDLTWLDDIDPEQLQSEIEFISVKKEEPMEEITEEANPLHDPIAVAPSPADSGISSPPVQVEYDEQVLTNRFCICGNAADYICGCRMAMYCSVPCQLKDWKAHKEICLKHNAKNGKEGNQAQ